MTPPQVRAPSGREAALDRTPKPCLHTHVTHRHGERITYVQDKCRCFPCAAASSRYNRQLAYGRTSFVDAGPAREHVQALMAGGMGHRQIAKLAGLDRKGVRDLVAGRVRDGRREPPKRKITRRVADAILAVPLPDASTLAPHMPVPALGTHRRLQALIALGWSQAKLARELSMTPANFGVMLLHQDQVLARRAVQVRELYERLSGTLPEPTSPADQGGINRARTHAKRHGWAPPLAWDDADLDDPDAKPHVATIHASRKGRDLDEVAIERVMAGDRELARSLSKYERADVVRRLVALGCSDGEVERRTGISARTALRVRHADDASVPEDAAI